MSFGKGPFSMKARFSLNCFKESLPKMILLTQEFIMNLNANSLSDIPVWCASVEYFKCKGFKCHNTDIGEGQVKIGPQDNHCIEPKEFIVHSNNIKDSTILNIPLSKVIINVYWFY